MFKGKFKFPHKSDKKDSEARQRLQKELFEYVQSMFHGFPSKPSVLAYDPILNLMAIGTKSSYPVRIFGAPGVEFSTDCLEDFNVIDIKFFEGEGGLLVRTDSDNVYFMEINVEQSTIEIKNNFTLNQENDQIKIICMEITNNKSEIYFGCQNGDIQVFERSSWKHKQTIRHNDILKDKPESFKLSAGWVESVKFQPGNEQNLLIGYERGLVVLFDLSNGVPLNTYGSDKDLSTICWSPDGNAFNAVYDDGSCTKHSIDNNEILKENEAVFGPFPCKPIPKLVETPSTNTESYLIFIGGMPRASYGERNTVTVIQGNKTVVFDFTSGVRDFVVIYSESNDQIPSSLIVLLEEELVAIDLITESWPEYQLPYLNSMHCSAITSVAHFDNVSTSFIDKLASLSETGCYSQHPWPISGGKCITCEIESRGLLVTGHEDGSVRFWDVTASNLKLLYKLSINHLFVGDTETNHEAADDKDEEWPPFRKAGVFDPYSDDPRLAVQKICLSVYDDLLLLGLTAGQILLLKFGIEERSTELKSKEVHIVGEADHFIWKGHEALPIQKNVKEIVGFQVHSLYQVYPPAACTSLSFQTDWGIIGVGTAHGFCAFDYNSPDPVLIAKSTLTPEDLEVASEGTARRKSFKKSLRESFRRLRRRRSDKMIKKLEKENEKRFNPNSINDATPKDSPERVRSVERPVEARKDDEALLNSMVRVIYFAETFLLNSTTAIKTMWVGTNGGDIIACEIFPGENSKKNETDNDRFRFVKTVTLQHRAPVLSIVVIDKTASPLPLSGEVKAGVRKEPDMTGDHSLVVVSEEQFKIFHLPNLKASKKFKLTAHEGSKIRKIGFVDFKSRSDENYKETEIAVLTNQGDIQVFNIPNLRRQIKIEAIRRENISGISSCIFSGFGYGFFLMSPSEFRRFSLSARCPHKSMSTLDFKEFKPEVVENGNENTDEPIEVESDELSDKISEMVVTKIVEEKKNYGEEIIDKNLIISNNSFNDSALSAVGTDKDITTDSVNVLVSDDSVNHESFVKTSTVTKEIVKDGVVIEQSTKTVVSSGGGGITTDIN